MLVLFVVNLEPLILGLIELNVEFRLSGIEWWATISNCARIATFTLPVFAVVAACVVDVCTRTRRDWAHWVGAVCFLSIGVIGCIWEIWGMLVPTVVQ
jgi:hypothetical protein